MKDYDYYTVDEIFKALESNTDGVLTRATMMSIQIVNKYGLAVEADDVFNEALVRILNDTRHVPKSVPLSYSIGQVIKSISHGMVELNKEKVFKHSEPIDDYSDKISAPSTEEDEPDPRWDELVAIFVGDTDAAAFLAATRNGLNKSAIVSSVFGGDEKAYDTTRKRIIRNGQKYLKEVGLWLTKR